MREVGEINVDGKFSEANLTDKVDKVLFGKFHDFEAVTFK